MLLWLGPDLINHWFKTKPRFIYVNINTGVFWNVPWSLDQNHKHESRYRFDLYSRYFFSISWIQSWLLRTCVRTTLVRSLSNTHSATIYTCNATSHTCNATSQTSAFHTRTTLNRMQWTKITTWFIALQILYSILSCNTYFIDHAKTF